MPRIVNGVVVNDDAEARPRKQGSRRFRTLHDQGSAQHEDETRFNGGASDRGGSSTSYFPGQS